MKTKKEQKKTKLRHNGSPIYLEALKTKRRHESILGSFEA